MTRPLDVALVDFAAADALERRYDGPIPPADPACPPAPPHALRARLFERLAAEAVCLAAGRRLRLTADQAGRDGRLTGLARSLSVYRREGVSDLLPAGKVPPAGSLR